MSEARLADALARLERHENLDLPLRPRDLLGRLVLRFLWRRGWRAQVDVNLAARDAITGLRDIIRTHDDLATVDQLRTALDELRRSDGNLLAGLNQRLYSAVGGLRTELSDLRLQLADKADHTDDITTRLTALEHEVAALADAARDVRLRHAQVDLLLDHLRPTPTPADPVPTRLAAMELAVAELLDGPVDRVRADRRAYLPVITPTRGPVFDMAPGRGEWLDVLRAADIPARAASTNPAVLRRCAGHTVHDADPLTELANVAGRLLGAVTAFRYVERLAPDELARFVDLAAQAVLPGGVLVVETPTTTADFRLDPFARQPVHPTFLRFLAEAAGFADVTVRDADSGHADRYCLIARM